MLVCSRYLIWNWGTFDFYSDNWEECYFSLFWIPFYIRSSSITLKPYHFFEENSFNADKEKLKPIFICFILERYNSLVLDFRLNNISAFLHLVLRCLSLNSIVVKSFFFLFNKFLLTVINYPHEKPLFFYLQLEFDSLWDYMNGVFSSLNGFWICIFYFS